MLGIWYDMEEKNFFSIDRCILHGKHQILPYCDTGTTIQNGSAVQKFQKKTAVSFSNLTICAC